MRNTTILPDTARAHAPHSITDALAKIMGKDKHDTTTPVVRNIHNSTQALLALSKLPDNRLEMMVGTGTRK